MENSKKMLLSNQLSFGILGALEAAWAPMAPFVKSGLNLDDAQFGQLLLSIGLGSIIALPTVGPLISRFGPRLIAMLSCMTLAISLVCVTFSSSVIFMSVMLAIFGASLIGVDVASNVNAVVMESIFKRPLMSGFHGGYSFGTIVGALFVAMLLTVGLNIQASSILLLIVMGSLTLWGLRPLVKDVKEFNQEQVATKEQTTKKHKFAFPAVIFVLGVLCFIMYGSEGALLHWGAVFATQNRGINPEVAGYFYLFFAFAMTITRFTGNKIVTKCGRCRTVVVGAIMVGFGFIITAFLENSFGMMLGFTLIGLGAGNIVPQLVSFAGTIKGIKVQSAISVINALGYSGILLAPVIVGHISNLSSLEISFVVLGTAVFFVAFVSFLILRRKA